MKAGLQTLLDGTYIMSSKENVNSKTLIVCTSSLIMKEEKKPGDKITMTNRPKNGNGKQQTAVRKPSENTKGETPNRKHRLL